MEDPACPHAVDAAAGLLAALGEAAVLRRIVPLLPVARSAVLGPGDDAAVLAAPDGRLVVTTDLMVHGPDFRWEWSSPHDIGWKAAASNLADVAAMGARPSALVVALAAPPETSIETLEGIARGFADACAALAPGCGVIGGDLSVSETFTVAVTAFGDLEGREAVTRSGARLGDVVVLSGERGLAGAGLRLLVERAVDAAGRPDPARAAALRESHAREIEAQLAPRPPIGDGVLAALAGAHAMMDVSDGLAIDAGRLAAASGVALDLDSSLLGPEPGAALAGGEDHALLACFAPESALPGGFTRIGSVVAGEGLLVDGAPAPETGWDPYRR